MQKLITTFHKFFDVKHFLIFFRLIIILVVVLFLFKFNDFTKSRYVSDADINVAPRIAFFVVDVGTYTNSFKLDEVIPSSSPYLYTFQVTNFKDDKKINVNLEYDIKMTTTTNLPLNYKIYKSSNVTGPGIITDDNIITNSDNMYFREMQIDEVFNFSFNEFETDNYVLWVEFPENYKFFSKDYEGVIELVEIIVTARQTV